MDDAAILDCWLRSLCKAQKSCTPFYGVTSLWTAYDRHCFEWLSFISLNVLVWRARLTSGNYLPGRVKETRVLTWVGKCMRTNWLAYLDDKKNPKVGQSRRLTGDNQMSRDIAYSCDVCVCLCPQAIMPTTGQALSSVPNEFIFVDSPVFIICLNLQGVNRWDYTCPELQLRNIVQRCAVSNNVLRIY